jgi:hypothetical protein
MKTKTARRGFYVDNWKLAVGFRVLLAATAICGVVMNLVMMRGGLFDGLSYYTLQSNIIALIFFGFLAYRTWRYRGEKPVSPAVKGAVMICVTLTFLIFHFVLRPTMFSMGAAGAYMMSPANILVHYVVPLMAIADWLVFDRKGSFGKLDPLKWTIIPWAYLAFSLVRAQFTVFMSSGSRYPYFFIDLDTLGVGQVAINVLVIAVGYVGLGYLIYLVDWGMAKLGRSVRGETAK